MSGFTLVSGLGEAGVQDCVTPEETLKTWMFTYDGVGVKVKQVYTEGESVLITYYYAGGSYEVQTDGTTETLKQYYSIAGMTVAVRAGDDWSYFLTDHLGSVVGVTDDVGALISEARYMPFGEVRDLGEQVNGITQTDFGYTFQRNMPDTGLMDYKARSYDPWLGRWTQPDTIVPGAANPQAWNRYGYVGINPINATDPSGHKCKSDGDECEKEEIFEITIILKTKYSIDINGGWTVEQLKMLRSVLSNYSHYLGGIDKLNGILEKAASNLGIDKIGFTRVAGSGSIGNKNGSNGTYSAAWCNVKNTKCSGNFGNIVLSDNVFTPDYQKIMSFRKILKLNYSQGMQMTVAHELSHVFLSVNTDILNEFGVSFPNRPTNPQSNDENLANVLAAYIVTGGISWPGNDDLFDFVKAKSGQWKP